MKGLATIFRNTPARGVRTGRRLAHWNEMLEEWCLIHERYCRLVENDAVYWNIERANLAALAAAAWRAGWAALEEFTQDKMLRRSRFAGRADLFLRSPKAQDYVESKIVWPGGGTRSVNATGTLRALERARKDAQAVHLANGSGDRIGIVFAVPYFRSDVERPALPQLLGPFFEDLEGASVDAVAWCFPPLAQELVWPTGRKKHAYPGVILLASAV